MGVLSLEDERPIDSDLLTYLRADGIEASTTTGPSPRDPCSLWIVRWLCPENDVLDRCRDLRFSNEDIAILVLASHLTLDERCKAFEAGVDDIGDLAMHPREVAARVRALLRRRPSSVPPTPRPALVNESGIRIDASGQRAYAGVVPLDLTRTELALLKHLLDHRGEVQTREMLFAAVWQGRNDARTSLVKVHVRNLREKLGATAASLATIPGKGYVIR